MKNAPDTRVLFWVTSLLLILSACTPNNWQKEFSSETCWSDLDALQKQSIDRQADAKLVYDYLHIETTEIGLKHFKGRTYDNIFHEADSVNHLILEALESNYLGWDSIKVTKDSAVGEIELLRVRIAVTNKSSFPIHNGQGKYIFYFEGKPDPWTEYMGIENALGPGETLVDTLMYISTPLDDSIVAALPGELKVGLKMYHFSKVNGRAYHRFQDL